MELTQQDFLEELLAPRIESYNTFASGVKEFFPNAWNIESPTFYQQNPEFIASNSSFLGLISPSESIFPCPFSTSHESYPFLDSFNTAPAEVDSSTYIQQEYNNRAIVEEGEIGLISTDFQGHYGQQEDSISNCFNNKVVKMEEATSTINGHVPNIVGLEKKSSNKVKKVGGQPSKNLMAERRRRKRLNDRLSMLRSIVPKISKMDRTSILGDTIDYVKELLDKINSFREEHEMEDKIKDIKFMGNFKELKPNEALVRNPPKFDVERRSNEKTSIEVCCATKPGLLLSTANTIEALGLDVEQCVVSCFSDFSMRASCSEATDHRTILSSDDVKQALFKTAGYGGRCL